MRKLVYVFINVCVCMHMLYIFGTLKRELTHFISGTYVFSVEPVLEQAVIIHFYQVLSILAQLVRCSGLVVK